MSPHFRVLHVIPSIAPSTGGPAQVVADMSRALVRAGHAVTIATTDLPGAASGWGAPRRGATDLRPVVSRLRSDGVDVRVYPVDWPGRYAYSRSMGDALRHLIPTFDLVHIHSLYLYPTWAAARICRDHSVPYIIRPLGTMLSYQRSRSRRLKQIYDAFCGRAITESAALLHFTSINELDESTDLSQRSRARDVRLGVETSVYAHLPARGSFRSRFTAIGDRPVVLFLGRIAPKKGLDLLVPAFATVLAAVPDAVLIIAGSGDAGYTASVRAEVRSIGLEASVIFAGFLEGKAKLAALADADVWTLPSYSENFGVAVIEAIAAGLPVVISDQVDVHPVISLHAAGIVVPCNRAALAEALIRLVTDQAERWAIGLNGRRLATEYYSWDVVVKDILAMYEEVIRR